MKLRGTVVDNRFEIDNVKKRREGDRMCVYTQLQKKTFMSKSNCIFCETEPLVCDFKKHLNKLV